MVIYGVAELLFAAQVALRCLHRNVTQKKLDVFQFAAGKMTQTSTRSAQIMGSKIVYATSLGG